MRQPTVKLHGEPILLIVGIPVRGPAVNDDTHLVLRPWQAMSALDVTQIPVFEHRVDPVAGRRENIIELDPPAHFLAYRHRGPELFLGGKPPTASPGNPIAGIVERQGKLNQVEHGLLDARPGWFAVKLRGFSDPLRYPDDEAGGLDSPG